MKIKYIFLILTTVNSFNFICKAADANKKALEMPNIGECKAKAEKLFKRREDANQWLIIKNDPEIVKTEKQRCDNALRKLLQLVQIINMTLYIRIKSKLDDLQAEERYRENKN